MLYAKVVLGLPIAGPFDYEVPPEFIAQAKIGMRVVVNFSHRKMIGYIIGLARKSTITQVKPLLRLIDKLPILDKNMLALTSQLSEYYCCSWGEAIETALPEAIRKGRALADFEVLEPIQATFKPETILLHVSDSTQKWEIYLSRMKDALAAGRSVIILFPDLHALTNAKEIIVKSMALPVAILTRKETGELNEWARVKNQEVRIVVGSRSAVFAPLNNLGLIIIDQEEDSVYKQDQVPHYHARNIAFMRARLEKSMLILSSFAPALESFYLAEKHKWRHLYLAPQRQRPEIKVIDMNNFAYADRKNKNFFSKYMQDFILDGLATGKKTLLFLNRRGFATAGTCLSCGAVLKCPRCNLNLIIIFRIIF